MGALNFSVPRVFAFFLWNLLQNSHIVFEHFFVKCLRMLLQSGPAGKCEHPCEDDSSKFHEGNAFADDMRNSMPLDRRIVVDARGLEMGFSRNMGVGIEVPGGFATSRVVAHKWFDTHNGDEDNPDDRAHLVAREVGIRDGRGFVCGCAAIGVARVHRKQLRL